MRQLTVLALLGVACAHRTVDSGAEDLRLLLAAADDAWARRGALSASEVEAPLEEAYGRFPNSPEVLWRFVRLRVAEGLSHPEPRTAQYAFAQGRDLGAQCLALDTAFTQFRLEAGWPEGLAQLDSAYGSCAAWFALAWARWLAAHGGEAAALDLERLDQLLARAGELAGPEHGDVVSWAFGVVAAARPTWAGQDLTRARKALEQGLDRADFALSRRADLVLLVAVPAGDAAFAESQRAAILAAPARTAEDRRAQEAVRP